MVCSSAFVVQVVWPNTKVGRDVSIAIAGRVSSDTAESVDRFSISVSDQIFEQIAIPIKREIQPLPTWLVG